MSDSIPAICITVMYTIDVCTCAFIIQVAIDLCISVHPRTFMREHPQSCVCLCGSQKLRPNVFCVFCWDGLSLNPKLSGPGVLLLQPLAPGPQGHCYPQTFHVDARNPSPGPQTCGAVSTLTTNLFWQLQLTAFKWLKICRLCYDLSHRHSGLQTSVLGAVSKRPSVWRKPPWRRLSFRCLL